MNKIIGVTELQRKFRTVFDQVVKENTPFILTRGSRAEAVLLPYDQYVQYLKLDEVGVHQRFDELLARMARVNAHFTDEEVERDLEEATRIVRTRRRRREARKKVRTSKPNGSKQATK